MARSSQLGRRAARPADGEQAQKADGRSLRRQPVLMRVICGDDRERQRAGQVPSISAFGTLQVLRQSRQRRYQLPFHSACDVDVCALACVARGERLAIEASFNRAILGGHDVLGEAHHIF